MPLFTDQLGRTIRVESTPISIVSLVPSQTELLYDLGLDANVSGITKFCVHPEEWFRRKRRVGGTKNVHIDVVKELNPDLILANKEENVKAQIEALENIAPVWVSDVNNLDDALQMIRSVGNITGENDNATEIIQRIKAGFENLIISHQFSVAYLIWKGPYMTVGGDTFITDMLTRSGFRNVFADLRRYPEIDIEALQKAKPDFVFLSSEPYPFKEKHIEELQAQLPFSKVILVDGEMFSWYGSRMVKAVDYFKRLVGDIA
ncbi:MAG: ABC transporter substrate-binding protein [Filimonas sp.]|nr:ABC transporter substrate-binding protein [Filimonas sp.]